MPEISNNKERNNDVYSENNWNDVLIAKEGSEFLLTMVTVVTVVIVTINVNIDVINIIDKHEIQHYC
ncbi:hypothetical protein PIROE2DRAFT_14209 [Piromyces sp. E2]|nr:hypothetical protein PIROE2DRAFT_14209 [Piromyces sp. E2]|eukprot:OUM60086.1 hypothetical protein PIROE2DRAFT_14209 [Piromyces sp. E2]